MENIYKVRLMFHIKSLQSSIIVTLLTFLLCYFLLDQNKRFDFNAYALGAVPVFLIVLAPTLYLHVTYYIKNAGLSLRMDESQHLFKIIHSDHELLHTFSNIVSVEQHLGIYYRNRIDNAARRIAPWTRYGYLIIKLKNGEQICLTSLMIDIHNPPFKATHTYFRFFPYLKLGMEMNEKRLIISNRFQNEVSSYKLTFKNHSNEQLNEKIVNKRTYAKSAVEAAKQVLASRK
jgi:hypothetical protein